MTRHVRIVAAIGGLLMACGSGSIGAVESSAVDAAEQESERSVRPLARLALEIVFDVPVSLSADGRYVAFESRAGLVPADVNGSSDVYVLDRISGQLTLESVAFDGRAANGSSSAPRLSGDGRWLLFESAATNLTREAAGQRCDILLRDRLAGTTRGLLRPRPISDPTHDGGNGAAISMDGRVVAFSSNDAHLVDGIDANGSGSDVYVLTLDTGVIVRASVMSSGVQPAAGTSFAPTLNADGTIVAFTSTADLERGGARLERPQVFVRDLAHGTTRLVSAAPNGRPANQMSHSPAISADGRLVAFVSTASNLGPSDDNRLSDIYVRDLQTGAIRLVSRTRRGKAGNGHSSHPAISADGQFVAFVSEASDLACGWRCPQDEVDDNLLPDIYLADLRTGTVQRVSGDTERVWWAASQAPAIDAHGTMVAFLSKEPIDPLDVANDFDLFVWIRSRPQVGS